MVNLGADWLTAYSHVITMANLGADWLTACSHVITMVNLGADWLTAQSHVIKRVNQGDDWSIALWLSDYSGMIIRFVIGKSLAIFQKMFCARQSKRYCS